MRKLRIIGLRKIRRSPQEGTCGKLLLTPRELLLPKIGGRLPTDWLIMREKFVSSQTLKRLKPIESKTRGLTHKSVLHGSYSIVALWLNLIGIIAASINHWLNFP